MGAEQGLLFGRGRGALWPLTHPDAGQAGPEVLWHRLPSGRGDTHQEGLELGRVLGPTEPRLEVHQRLPRRLHPDRPHASGLIVEHHELGAPGLQADLDPPQLALSGAPLVLGQGLAQRSGDLDGRDAELIHGGRW